jgi:predicted O-linked N-acetylglucosamine transferase (SPINDLY family)
MAQVTIPEAMRLAVEHHRSNRLSQAETIYRQVLGVQPNNPDALYLLGVIAQQVGRHADAVDLLRRAVAADPRHAAWRSTYGVSLALSGEVDEAIHQFEQAIILDPNLPDAHLNLGNSFNLRGRQDDAVRAFRHALKLKPDYVEAHFNLANALRERDVNEAAEHYRAVIRQRPMVLAAHEQLAVMLHAARRWDEAIAEYRHIIDLNPLLADSHYNLGVCQLEAGRREQAVQTFRETIRLNPDHAAAHFNLAVALGEGAPVEELYRECREAVRLDPDNRRAYDNFLHLSHYLTDTDPAAVFDDHVEWAHRFELPLMEVSEPHPIDFSLAGSSTGGGAAGGGANGDGERRLRVGFVSRDFREHSVSYFFEPVLTAHAPARSRLEIFCYADDIAPDETTARLRRKCDVWRDVTRMTEAEIAELVRQDRIDILVDLAGHTEMNRLLVFARKPAPVQVTWLGYPDTTGMRSMDYRITDAIADPPGESDRLNTERLLRLPCGWCYQPPQNAPPVTSVPPSERAGGVVTFGCFNQVAKINLPLVELWAKVMHEVPTSRMVIKARTLEREDVRRRFVMAFADHGIAAARVDFLPAMPSLEEHLRCYSRVDVALDTFPYAGTTTTCEALWMGVPVVTLTGRTHASRVGASLLTAIGQTEWITSDRHAFVRRAVELATNVADRRMWRGELRPMMARSILLNAAGFRQSLEHRLIEIRHDGARAVGA